MKGFLQLENAAKNKLNSEFGSLVGDDLWGGYVSARNKVFHDVLPFINQKEPCLSDHGPRHIEDVLDNAFQLLGDDGCCGNNSKTSLNGAELYFLVLAILLHDTGNIHGRKDHQRKLQASYEYARGKTNKLATERRLLFPIIGAHCGKGMSGTSDTIYSLANDDVFKKQRLDSQRVASVLRFADELAEGQQRTSAFMAEHFPYPHDSQVYHDYANVTEIHIDRDNSRIVVIYDIDVNFGVDDCFDKPRLRTLIEFCEQRAIKLDLERKYNRHYCSLLRPFKKTEIKFHFNEGGRQLKLEGDMPKIVLDDLVLPKPLEGESLFKKTTGMSAEEIVKKVIIATEKQ